MSDKKNIHIARRIDEETAPDEADVVDLDALINDYNQGPKRKNDPSAAKRKNEDLALEEEDDPFAVRQPAKQGESVPDLGQQLGRVGEQVGRDLGKMGEEFGRLGAKFGREFNLKGGRKARAGLGQFLRHPYDPDYAPQYDQAADSNERNWAAIAHLFGLISIPAGVFSGGLSSLVFLVVPLLIYLNFRGKSSFTAKHALQALLAQAMTTLGIYAAITVSGIAGVILTVILALTIIGIIAIPFLWLGLVLFWAALFIAPLGAWVLSFVGAINASQGKTYKYPYIGRWTK